MRGSMDPDGSPPPPPPPPAAGTCACGCLCCSSSSSTSEWNRAAAKGAAAPDVARVEAETEVSALREALSRHQMSVQELYTELDEERNASSTAASEAMSMILRLQREKAEAQMEARQFKRLADEKMAHDQHEIAALEDLLFKREQVVISLSSELQIHKQRLAGASSEIHTPRSPLTPSNPAGVVVYDDIPDYPPLRCSVPAVDLDIYGGRGDCSNAASPTTQTPRDRLQSIEQRIHRLERSQSVMEKTVVGYYSSPRWPRRHHRGLSYDSFGSASFRRDEFPHSVDRFVSSAAAAAGENDYVNDRVVHCAPSADFDDLMSTPREIDDDEVAVKRLYMRLQALEADRESMRQAIMSMSTDKAQMVLLKEIAHHLCKEVVAPEEEEEEVEIAKKKPSLTRSFSIAAVFKWIMLLGRRRKQRRCRYSFGLSSSNAGLLTLLDKAPGAARRISVQRPHGWSMNSGCGSAFA